MLASRVLDLDFDEIEKWHDLHGQKLHDRAFFPRIGFIVRGLAAGFIYFTDSKVVILDGFISNPKADAKTRDEALNAVGRALIECARFHECRIIKADTQLDAIKKRIINFGGRSIGTYEAFILEI